MRYIDRFQVARETTKINHILKYVSTDDITDDGKLIRAAGFLLGEKIGSKKSVKRDKRWKRRLEWGIKRLSKDLSKIDAWHLGEWRRKKEGERSHLAEFIRSKEKGLKQPWAN